MNEIRIGARGTDYGNWMSKAFMRVFASAAAVTAILFCLCAFLINILPLTIIVGVLLVVVIAFAIWIAKVRQAFSFTGGRVMEKIQQNLVAHLDWDGIGMGLDIGCGSGSMTIMCAKKFENSRMVGIDFWGSMWDYSKALCEQNAKLEGVGDRCKFIHDDAIDMDFEDETFDMVASNFVYHEVRNEPDKTKLIMETMRVLKKGGTFALQDFFDREEMFGKPEDIIAALKDAGISEVHYKGNIDEEGWIPKYVLSPMVIKDIGLLWGKK